MKAECKRIVGTIIYDAYVIVASLLGIFLIPFLILYFHVTGRFDKKFIQRLGFYPQSIIPRLKSKPRIWFHAASVGEVRVAVSIIQSFSRLKPDHQIIVSTITPHGHAVACSSFDPSVICIYAPIDLIFCIRKALIHVKPDIIVFLETEIWPVWICEAHRLGIKTAIVNGRISSRSINRYLLIRPFIEFVLQHMDVFSMISEGDADRIRFMGAPENKVVINGNAKYDRFAQLCDDSIPRTIANTYQISDQHLVWVAGSTRSGEEEILIDVYRTLLAKFPNLIFIIAPRHIERSEQIKNMIQSAGFLCQFRTDLDHQQRYSSIIILNTIGELQSVYSIATVVFCGGSLVPLGGQNILEPAAWGKPVFYGPSMDDFADAQELLEKTGGGIRVTDGDDLCCKLITCLSNLDHCRQIGQCAKKAAMATMGSADKHSAALVKLIGRFI